MAVFAPKHFSKDRDTWLATISDYNFGTLVVPSFNPLNPNDVRTVRTPFVLHGDSELSLHVNAENPLWKTIENYENEHENEDGAPVVVLFDGPHHYVSPSWFHTEQVNPGTKVPTWDYVSVTVKGKAKIVKDISQKIDLLGQLSEKHEKGRNPWRIHTVESDKLRKMISMIKIKITELSGSFKMNQNSPTADRDSVSLNLARVGTDDAIATGFLIQNNAHPSPMLALRDKMRANGRSRRAQQASVQTERRNYKDMAIGACLVGVPMLLCFANKVIRNN